MHLHADPLARQALEHGGQFGAGLFRCRISRLRAKPRLKPEVAQDPQVILADALTRIADEAHPPCRQIFQPAEIVEDFACRRIGIERIDGEIAPRGIVPPFAGEGHGGAAAVGADVMTQRGDLDRALRQQCGDGAVLDAGGNSAGYSALASRAITSSGTSGVARSMSFTAMPSSVSRTAPPT